MDNFTIKEAPFLKFYESFKTSTIYTPEISDKFPEQFIRQKSLIDPILKKYLVNTDYPISGLDDMLRWLVFQHIRKVGEVLAGTYEVDNEEFDYVFRPFIRDAIMGEVWVAYSEDLLNMELEALKHPDIYGRYTKQDLIPESKFRLYRRYVETRRDGKEIAKFSSSITGMQGFIIDEEQFPMVKCSFNGGMFFWDMWQVFLNLETGMQQADWEFFVSGKKLKCRVKDPSSFKEDLQQLRGVGSVFAPSNKISSTMNHYELMDIQSRQECREAYDYVLNRFNNDMTRFGLGGDDSSKAERITTGENFRALQPNSSYQKSILQFLKQITNKIRENLQQEVNFSLAIQSNEQGIPEIEDEFEKDTDEKPDE